MHLSSREHRALILQNQFLTRAGSLPAVAGALCGVQAQYQSFARRALSLRCPSASQEEAQRTLVKSWTLRGTLHAFPVADLPLFLHRGRSPVLRPADTLQADALASGERKQAFAACILERLSDGPASREALKDCCRAAGMIPEEEASLFDPWGGLLRALCEGGRICHCFTEQKQFCLCPDFTPMEAEAARTELLSRYFAAYGPATLQDAARFLGLPQRVLRPLLPRLELSAYSVDGRLCLGPPLPEHLPHRLPEALFLPGFDPLMLGYAPDQNPFLPPDRRREIFAAGGQVRPVLLLAGQAAGSWRQQGSILSIRLFAPLSSEAAARLEEAARRAFPQARQVRFPS